MRENGRPCGVTMRDMRLSSDASTGNVGGKCNTGKLHASWEAHLGL